MATGDQSDNIELEEARNDEENQIDLDDEDVFEVEEIVGSKKQGNKTLYKVRWLGYGPQQDTWEPVENLTTCQDLIDKYLSKKKPVQRKKSAGKWVMVTIDDEEDAPGSSKTDPFGLLRDPFWKNLEAGKIDVFEGGDMYSKVKGRATRPISYSDTASTTKKQTPPKTANKNTRRKSQDSETSIQPKKKGKKRRSNAEDSIESNSSQPDNTNVEQKRMTRNSVANDCSTSESEVTILEPSSKRDLRPRACNAAIEVNSESSLSASENDNANIEDGSCDKIEADTPVTVSESPAELICDVKDSMTETETVTEELQSESLKSADKVENSLDVSNTESVQLETSECCADSIASDAKCDVILTDNSATMCDLVAMDDLDKSKDLKLDILDSGLDAIVPLNKLETAVLLDSIKDDDMDQCTSGFKDILMEPNIQKKDNKFGDDLQFNLDEFNPEEWIPEDLQDQMESVHLSNLQFAEAVQSGDYDKVKQALNNSSNTYDVEQPDPHGTTLLMAAALAGFDEIVELLVLHGANINARHKSGNTALMLASDKGHLCTVAALCQLGAQLDLQQYTGETALMKACKRGHTAIVRCLLENGVNFAVIGQQNISALSLAKMYSHTESQDWLHRHISRVTNAFEAQVNLTLNNTATIQHCLFPLQCFSLSHGPTFSMTFHHDLQPLDSGVGMLLFIAHARINPIEIKCRLFGQCAVVAAYLNQVKLSPLTEDANFVLSFCPLQNGRNDLVINCISAPTSKCKLLVCAYQAQLTSRYQNGMCS